MAKKLLASANTCCVGGVKHLKLDVKAPIPFCPGLFSDSAIKVFYFVAGQTVRSIRLPHQDQIIAVKRYFQNVFLYMSMDLLILKVVKLQSWCFAPESLSIMKKMCCFAENSVLLHIQQSFRKYIYI